MRGKIMAGAAALAAALLIPVLAGTFSEAEKEPRGDGVPVSTTSVEVYGQLLDEAGEPMANTDLTAYFYLGPELPQRTVGLETDGQGLFHLDEQVEHEGYLAGGQWYAELQVGLQLPESTVQFTYVPGTAPVCTPENAEIRWAEGRVYGGSYLSLARTVRREADSGAAVPIPDGGVSMGSQLSPEGVEVVRQFAVTERFTRRDGNSLAPELYHAGLTGRSQFAGRPPESLTVGGETYRYLGYRQGDSGTVELGLPELELTADVVLTYVYAAEEAEETVVTVLHRFADGRQAAPDQMYQLELAQSYIDTVPAMVADFAPLRVEVDGAEVASAWVDRAISGYRVTLLPGQMTVCYYYARDADGNGVPDYTLTQRQELESGEAIGQIDTRTVNRGEALTLTAPQVPDYIAAGWRLDDAPMSGGILQLTVTEDRQVAWVYRAADPPGPSPEPTAPIEPPPGPEHTVTLEFRRRDGEEIRPAERLSVRHGLIYQPDCPDLEDYVYVGWHCTELEGEGVPTVEVEGDITLVLIYGWDRNRNGVEDFLITERHELEEDGAILHLAQWPVDRGQTYTAAPLMDEQWIYMGWLDQDETCHQGQAAIPVVDRDETITLVYRPAEEDEENDPEDNGQGETDGQEGTGATAWIAVNAVCQRDGQLLWRQSSQSETGQRWAMTVPSAEGHRFVRWRLDDGEWQTGDSVVIDVQDDHQVTLEYSHRRYSVRLEQTDLQGDQLAEPSVWMVDYGEPFVPPIADDGELALTGWRCNGVEQSGPPVLQQVVEDTVMELLYRRVPDRPVQFLKQTNTLWVKPGETVTYTFLGFGNSQGGPATGYTITDWPDKGLDLVSLNLPAFKGGESVTYSVLCTTNRGVQRTLGSGISAAAPFACQTPQLGPGEWITALEIRMGTVPEGFGLGDSFTAVFQVWEQPPESLLVNRALLSYELDGRRITHTAGENSASVYLDGRYADGGEVMGGETGTKPPAGRAGLVCGLLRGPGLWLCLLGLLLLIYLIWRIRREMDREREED